MEGRELEMRRGMKILCLPLLRGSRTGMMLGAALGALVPFESSKKSYLVGTAAAQGKADAGDKDESGEQDVPCSIRCCCR